MDSAFSESYNSVSHQITFTATSSFTLAANTGYFLVLSDPSAPGTTVSWDFTASQTYNSASGFSLPAANTSFVSLTDNSVSGAGSGYFPLSAGPQVFSLTVDAPTPEPSSAVLIAPLLAVAALFWRRKFLSAAV